MGDINREFELEMWKKSLSFGVDNGKSITTDYTTKEINTKINQIKGVETDAVLGRIVKRASTAQK